MRWIARVSRTHIAIVIVAILAFSSSFLYLKSLDKTVSVAQLAHDVIAGNEISNKNVDFVDIPLNEITTTQLISKSELKNKTLVARSDLSKSDLLTKSNTIRKTVDSGLQSLSLGLEIQRANGGDISKGDEIDIWVTGEDSRLVSSSISVREVIHPNKKLGISTSQLITIVIAVTQSQARDLSKIIGSDDIMVVLTNGVKTDPESAETTTNEEDEPFSPVEISGN